MKSFRAMVVVSGDPLSLERGAQDLFRALRAELKTLGLEAEVSLTMSAGLGRHDAAPLVMVYPEAVAYGPVRPGDARSLVEAHLRHGRVVEGMLAPASGPPGSLAWLPARQGTLPAERRIVLERAGVIDPESLEDYVAHGGYEALGKVLGGMSPGEVIEAVEWSGLRGRGGAGFPVGTKWRFVSKVDNYPKYVICNADESEPGTFKDRLVLEGDPHAIVEAMAIAGYAVGASEGYIYIRGEYKLAQARLRQAVEQARAKGYLGRGILGSGFAFDIHLHSGAGAYICGEETALIESIEGKRGEPRSRPPYPTTHGLWGRPTVVNNVETLANVPAIVRHGAEWYRGLGTKTSAGTKVYTLLGNVSVTGAIEVPMGITLREAIAFYGQGMKHGAPFKLAQTGGSSGTIIPAELQDVPLDFDSIRAGVSLGSGALLICDDRTCVVDLARVLLNFFRKESCGKCTPCRVGTERAYQLLTRLSEGAGEPGHLPELESLAHTLEQFSNCGLGQTAATPLRGILTHFRAEVEAHAGERICPAGACAMRLVEH